MQSTGQLTAGQRQRLVSLLAGGLERYIRAKPSLTPLPTVCLYDGHGDFEAVDD